MNRFTSVVTIAALAAGTLVTAPAQAKHIDPPQVTARSSVTIPWHACQSAGKWVNVTYDPGTRVDSSWVASVRKQGYTYPISEYKVCGYMGSGTYTLKTKVRWSVYTWTWRQVPVYRYRDVQKTIGHTDPEPIYEDWPFTCSLTTSSSGEGWINAQYKCALNNGRSWVDDYGSLIASEYVTSLPEGLWPHWPNGYTYPEATDYEKIGVWGNGTVPAPAAFTGTANVLAGETEPQPIYKTVSKRYVHHYRNKRVNLWLKQSPLTVKRVVQVTVR